MSFCPCSHVHSPPWAIVHPCVHSQSLMGCSSLVHGMGYPTPCVCSWHRLLFPPCLLMDKVCHPHSMVWAAGVHSWPGLSFIPVPIHSMGSCSFTSVHAWLPFTPLPIHTLVCAQHPICVSIDVHGNDASLQLHGNCVSVQWLPTGSGAVSVFLFCSDSVIHFAGDFECCLGFKVGIV